MIDAILDPNMASNPCLLYLVMLHNLKILWMLLQETNAGGLIVEEQPDWHNCSATNTTKTLTQASQKGPACSPNRRQPSLPSRADLHSKKRLAQQMHSADSCRPTPHPQPLKHTISDFKTACHQHCYNQGYPAQEETQQVLWTLLSPETLP